ncbi:MAG TPA: tripartite tricarboxylate transporter substrate binding protein [Casimicrobiaceae bacterium]|nr:tripartite tricarboxylate transporter substrate binding protein [Casimicrobiaceae bacterium]
MNRMHRRNSLRVIATLVFAAALPLATGAFAQAWPARPIGYVVPFTPGGTTDVIGRAIAQGLSPALGQPVVVDNKPGAAGAVGAGFVAKAKPDGYTLLGGTISTHAINASLYKDLPYDPVKDFEPITLVGFIPNALYVNADLGVNSVADLIAFLKKNPDKRTFASSGAGTSTHLAGELFADLIGVPLTHVPYKGTPQAFTDVVGGQVTFMFDQLTAGLPLVKGGKLKLLAVTTAKRATLSPETPTMMEAGVPTFEMVSWQAVYAPKGTPKPIVDRLNNEIVKILKSPDVRDKLVNVNGMEVVASSPAELTQLMQREIPRWAELVQKSGAKPN